jgi:hypothetical protein
MPETDTLLTTTQAGQLIGRGPRTVQRLIALGKIVPAHVLPGPAGAQLISRADMEAYAATLPSDYMTRRPGRRSTP